MDQTILDYFKAAKVTINSKVAIVENLEVKIDSTDEEFHKALFQADSLLSSFNLPQKTRFDINLFKHQALELYEAKQIFAQLDNVQTDFQPDVQENLANVGSNGGLAGLLLSILNKLDNIERDIVLKDDMDAVKRNIDETKTLFKNIGLVISLAANSAAKPTANPN